MDFTSLVQASSKAVLQKYLGKGEYPSFQSVAMFESSFVQVTRKGRHVFIHNHCNEAIIGIASTNSKLPLPNLMFIARPVAEQVSSPDSEAEELRLTRLLPLKFVRISIYNPKKQLIKIQLINGRSYYLQFRASTEEEEALFERWLSLVYLLHHPPSCYLSPQPTSCTVLDSLSIQVIPSEEEIEGFQVGFQEVFQEESQEGFQEVFKDVIQEGSQEGFQERFPEGFQEGFPEGFQEGFPEGFQEEFPEGFQEGFPEGFQEDVKDSPLSKVQEQKQNEPEQKSVVQLPEAAKMSRQSWIYHDEEYTEDEQQRLREKPKMTYSEMKTFMKSESFETYKGSTGPTPRPSRKFTTETFLTGSFTTTSSSSSQPPLSRKFPVPKKEGSSSLNIVTLFSAVSKTTDGQKNQKKKN